MKNRILVSEAKNESLNSYQDAIKVTGQQFINEKMILPQYVDACIDREKEYPTGLELKNGIGIAIPHGNQKFVKESGISFLRLKQPVNFGLMSDATKQVSCKFVFNLALFEGEQQLNMLRQLMGLFRDEKFIDFISKSDLNSIQKFLTQKLVF